MNARTSIAEAARCASMSPADQDSPLLEIEKILRAPGSTLHRDQVLARTDPHRAARERRYDGAARQMLECQVARDAGHPLHDVEPAEPCRENEVAAFSQVVRLERVEWELGRVEVARAEVVRLDHAQHVRQAVQVPTVGRGDDVDVLGCARKAMRAHGKPADQHVLDAAVGQCGDQLIRCELEFPRFRGHLSAEPVGALREDGVSCQPRIRSSSAVRRSRC